MKQLIGFIKEWTLPLSILLGTVTYFIFAGIPQLAPLKPFMLNAALWLMPVTIFCMLFFTFLRISPRDMRPRPWQWWILLLQTVFCLLTVGVALLTQAAGDSRLIFEAVLSCFIAPTATAAAVLTQKLGADAAPVTTHTIFDNIWVAVLITLLCPLLESHPELSTAMLITKIMIQVSQLLIAPLLLAWLVRYLTPRLCSLLLKPKNIAFYLWAIALVIVMAQTTRSVVQASDKGQVVLYIAIASAVCCAIQFYLGKQIGARYGDRIPSGQALAQKNSVFAIWMAYTYLTPLAALGPGAHVIWQNIYNAYQVWRYEHHPKKSK